MMGREDVEVEWSSSSLKKTQKTAENQQARRGNWMWAHNSLCPHCCWRTTTNCSSLKIEKNA